MPFAALGHLIVAAIGIIAVGIAAYPPSAEAQHGEIMFTCTNPASGTNWQIKVDYDHSTVDANPAQISERSISWHGAKDNTNYTLDRKSGELTVIIPSSTGGYFLYDRCKP